LAVPRADFPKRRSFGHSGAPISQKDGRLAKSACRFPETTVVGANPPPDFAKRLSFHRIGAPNWQKNRRFPLQPAICPVFGKFLLSQRLISRS